MLNFNSDVIDDNLRLNYISLLHGIPPFLLFKSEIVWSILAFILSLLLFYKTPWLNKLRSIKVISFEYYFELILGGFIGLISIFFIKDPSTAETILYIWVFFWFVSGIYFSHKLKELRKPN